MNFKSKNLMVGGARILWMFAILSLVPGLICAPDAQAQQPDRARFANKPPYSANHFPDWSGVWQKNRAPDVPFEADTLGLGTPKPPDISFTPEYAAKYKVLQDKVKQGIPIYIPATECFPPGMPYMLYTSYPMQIMMTPGLVTMITEYGGSFRNIYTDGRAQPDDIFPTYVGSAIGHWENDTLVVNTIGIRGDTTIDANGLPHSDALKLTERYREISPGVLELRLTMEDSKAFTKPATRVSTWKVQPDWTINEYICTENNRNPVDKDGSTKALLNKSNLK